MIYVDINIVEACQELPQVVGQFEDKWSVGWKATGVNPYIHPSNIKRL